MRRKEFTSEELAEINEKLKAIRIPSPVMQKFFGYWGECETDDEKRQLIRDFFGVMESARSQFSIIEVEFPKLKGKKK